jgi:hypothetical protein
MNHQRITAKPIRARTPAMGVASSNAAMRVGLVVVRRCGLSAYGWRQSGAQRPTDRRTSSARNSELFPHHTSSPVVTQHPALPLSGAPQSALPIAFGDDTCRLLAFQYEQAAPFNSVNDPRDQQAQRLPTARLAVSIRSFHAPEGMERSKQCLMKQLTESCRDGLHEKFFQ